MDNNKINIDNLFKQRLEGEEQMEREGAWLQMRNLLDKEMPQAKTSIFDLKRISIYASVLLLISSLFIGGYELNKHTNIFNTNNSIAIGSTNDALKNAPKVAAIDENSTNAAKTDNGEINSKQNDVTNNHNSTNKTTSNKIGNTNRENTGIVKNNITGNNKVLSSNIVSEKNQLASKNNNVKPNNNKPVKTNENYLANNNRSIKSINKEKQQSASIENDASRKTTALSVSEKQVSKNNNVENNNTKIKKGMKLATSVLGDKKLGNSNNLRNKMSKSIQNVEKGGNVTKNDEKSKSEKDNGYYTNQIVLNKRFVHDKTNAGHFNFDTISKEKLYQQLHSLKEVVGNENSLKPDIMGNAVANNVSGTNKNEGLQSDALGASSNSPSLKTAREKKLVNNKKSAGESMLSNLSAAFNDIKYSAKAMQFSKGLTAGANGTFFGPASFYGFQFGVTGSFNFGENFSITTEFKYFHKINSAYELRDDYYVYESNGGAGGGWKKSKENYDFSFSSLQSFEIPIAFKYNINNFSFFGGGNFLYTLGINTWAAPLPDPTPAQIVATKGNDDHPTLSYKDFGQRFGIGYLFGFSFSFSPNVALDLRSVQTVWDNMKLDGGKKVSSTLYNSPSIQLSVNYRLGASQGANNGK